MYARVRSSTRPNPRLRLWRILSISVSICALNASNCALGHVPACTRVYARVRACTRVYARVRACTRVYARVRACPIVHTPEPASSPVAYFVHFCVHLCAKCIELSVRTRTRVYPRVPACTRVYPRVRACTRVYARVRACTRVYARVRACTRVYARVRACPIVHAPEPASSPSCGVFCPSYGLPLSICASN